MREKSRWHAFVQAFDRVEDYTLILLLGGLLAVSILQIVTRNLYGRSLSWGDFATQYLVVWAGFLGASVAAREKKHILIDVLAIALPSRWRKWIDALVEWFSALVCAALVYSAIKYLHFEYTEGDKVLATVPVWALLAIFPISFGLMAARFFAHGLRSLESDAERPGT